MHLISLVNYRLSLRRRSPGRSNRINWHRPRNFDVKFRISPTIVSTFRNLSLFLLPKLSNFHGTQPPCIDSRVPFTATHGFQPSDFNPPRDTSEDTSRTRDLRKIVQFHGIKREQTRADARRKKGAETVGRTYATRLARVGGGEGRNGCRGQAEHNIADQ